MDDNVNLEEAVKMGCERCESAEPAKVYDPCTPGHPHKRVILCDECAAKDPKVKLDEKATGKLPKIIPMMKTEPSNMETEINQPEIIEENIVPIKPKASQNKAVDIETKPIDRVDIQKKISAQEKDIDALMGRRVEINQQLNQITEMIIAKKGAVAGLRDLLGDS